MVEVDIRIRFVTPCLGNVRDSAKNTSYMLKDSAGHVIFMQTWWRSGLAYAAKAMNIPPNRVKSIQWNPVVDGVVKSYPRFYGPGKYAVHEAFLKDDIIGVRAMLPDGMSVDQFGELLSLAGEYVGISPYGWKEDWGRFSVEEVRPRAYNRQRRESVEDNASDRVAGSGDDVHKEGGEDAGVQEEGNVQAVPPLSGDRGGGSGVDGMSDGLNPEGD